MRKPTSYFLLSIMAFSFVVHADASAKPDAPQIERPQAPFSSFTGKVVKNKVRLRLQPNLEGPILRELNRNDLLVVVGEKDDYYAVQPPDDIHAYVYRSYILDHIVDGNRVNVRLEPNTESPVVLQLNAGDKVEGNISPLNSKWMEIKLPLTARFYVAKDYIENIGDAKLMETISQKREEVNRLLNTTHQISLNELQKPYPEINLEGVNSSLARVISGYPELGEQVERAKSLQAMVQEHYLQKKIAYLEAKQANPVEDSSFKTDIVTLTPELSQDHLDSSLTANKLSAWEPVERLAFEKWEASHQGSSIEDFYQDQQLSSIHISGILESYDRIVKNKPGDYILVNDQVNPPKNYYLYSTKINLANLIGQRITVEVAERDNNNFAFPAYYVISVQ